MALALAVALLGGGGWAFASAAGGGLRIDWWNVSGGGGASGGGGFSVAGSVGQSDAGLLSGGPFRLEGGFWPGADQARQALFIPLITR